MTTTSTQRRIVTGVLIAAMALFGAACGGDDDETAGSQSATTAATSATTAGALGTTTAAAPNLVTIANFAFQGIDNARANSPWTITNSDSVPHTLSANDGSFVWRVEAGQTASFPRTLAAGSYPVRCDVHPTRMTGTLVVR